MWTTIKSLGLLAAHSLTTIILGSSIHGCSHSPQMPQDAAETSKPEHMRNAITIVYQSGRQGVIEPCGCKVTPNGGMDREFNLLQEYRTDGGPVLYIDGGDLYAPISLQKGMTPKLHIERADAITQMHNKMGLEVVTPGPGDILLGKVFLEKQHSASKAKWVSSNLRDKSSRLLFSPMEIIEKGGAKFAFLGIAPSSIKFKDGLRADDPRKTLTTWVPRAAAVADYVVVLSQLSSAKIEQSLLTDFPKINLWIGNDPTLNRQTPYQPNPHQIALDPHSQGFMTGVLQFQHKKPFKAWFSRSINESIKTEISGYQEALSSFPPGSPEYKSVETRIAIAKKDLVPEVDGATPFVSRLVGLDEKRYGQPNEITPMVEAEKKRVSQAAINAPAEKH